MILNIYKGFSIYYFSVLCKGTKTEPKKLKNNAVNTFYNFLIRKK